MTYLKGTTKAQTIFLRGFVKNPSGPPPQEWPSPAVLRRWLKRPGFCGAMNSILRSLRYQADFHLTAAAASGAHLLHTCVHAGDPAAVRRQIEALIALLRMSHIRHRFAEPLPQPSFSNFDFIAFLRTAHPDIKVGDALKFFDILDSPTDGPEETYRRSLWTRAGHGYDEEGNIAKEKGWDDDEEQDDEQSEEE